MGFVFVSLSQKTKRSVLRLWIQYSGIGRVICALVEIFQVSRVIMLENEMVKVCICI
jgi:hypothetical protein